MGLGGGDGFVSLWPVRQQEAMPRKVTGANSYEKLPSVFDISYLSTIRYHFFPQSEGKTAKKINSSAESC